MIPSATIAALMVLCVLFWIRSQHWKDQSEYNQRAAYRARLEATRAGRSADSWRAHSERLQDIVDRVEG